MLDGKEAKKPAGDVAAYRFTNQTDNNNLQWIIFK